MLAEMSRRHAADLQNVKEQTAIEKASWEEMFMRKQQATLRDKVCCVGGVGRGVGLAGFGKAMKKCAG